jgi:hypothetical protein
MIFHLLVSNLYLKAKDVPVQNQRWVVLLCPIHTVCVVGDCKKIVVTPVITLIDILGGSKHFMTGLAANCVVGSIRIDCSWFEVCCR